MLESIEEIRVNYPSLLRLKYFLIDQFDILSKEKAMEFFP